MDLDDWSTQSPDSAHSIATVVVLDVYAERVITLLDPRVSYSSDCAPRGVCGRAVGEQTQRLAGFSAPRGLPARDELLEALRLVVLARRDEQQLGCGSECG